jgi:cytoskeletal protein CcmA (bactofilin family)
MVFNSGLFSSNSSDDLSPEELALLDQLDQSDDDSILTRRAGKQTVIGADVIMNGELNSRNSISIKGELRGIATSGDRIVLEASGRVKGDLSAIDVVVDGHITGNISARRRLELKSKAHLEGGLNEQPEVLVIHEKASFGHGA